MKRRVLGFGDCCYHVVSRINERRFYLGTVQKQHFLELLFAAADFSGVKILTYCIMDDHFHLLVRVPSPKSITHKELLRRLKILYKADEYDALEKGFNHCLRSGDERLVHSFRLRFVRRMYNLSEFVRTLKHRFSMWYNKKHDREGPLWTGRFKSLLVQSSADEYGFRALSAVAAYIDLNAVRANLVRKAENYDWCGFSRLIQGDKVLLSALQYIFGRVKTGLNTRQKLIAKYQKVLSVATLPRINCFTSGWILGKHGFVDFVARRRPECFKTGRFDIAERVSALPESGLFTIKKQTFIVE